jgi:tRNA nucleotidyltransferase (CCA-adding enzyme)
MINKIPKYIAEIIQKLEMAGFEGFVVGGCVRDLILKDLRRASQSESDQSVGPKDWDIATNAKPEEIMKIFPDSVYENQFGTVAVKIKMQISKWKMTNQNKKLLKDKSNNEITEIVEITTYRIESKYSDKRHPDEVKFAKTLEEDLSRRDFTINAMALKVKSQKSKVKNASQNLKVQTPPSLRDTSPLKGEEDLVKVIDLFDGQKDLKNGIIKAVGDANDRFDEDALRMMRAIRFAVQINFKIEKNTLEAVKKNAKNLKYISAERIKDEFEKIILSNHPAKGIMLLYETGLLKQLIPEFEKSVGVEQGFHHYDGPYRFVFDHLVASLEKCPSKKLEVRLACLFHDIGKPKTKGGSGKETTFYNHQYAGAKMTREILSRLRFSRETIDKTVLLVQNHMFYYNVDEVGESGVRRVVRKVGLENINDLIDVRIADRLGSGVAKAVPYKLRHFKYMVEKVSKDPISVKQLKINGNDLIRELKIQPGPKMGAILDVLLAKVIENPNLNSKEDLLKLAKKLLGEDLSKLREMAKEKIEEEREQEDIKVKKRYWVK